MHMGPDFILVNLSVDFNDAISADEVERSIGHLDRRIKQVYPQIKRVFIEAEKRVNQKAATVQGSDS
jgi:divalent metal cation (Fe/Co/Zn/Cd) transporter